MPENSNFSERSKSGLTEDVVLISVILIGFVGSVLIYVYELSVPPIVVAVLLGSAVAALVYRFLGGISTKDSFSLGAIKLGGSMAALISCAWFINSELTTQTKNLDQLFDPHYRSWFAFNRTIPSPLDVRVSGFGVLPGPPDDLFDNVSLRLEPAGESFRVSANDSVGFILGKIDKSFLEQLGWKIETGEQLYDFLVTDRLPPDTSGISLDPLPFILATGRYGGEYSRYRLQDGNGNPVMDGSIYRKQTQLFEWQNRKFLIAVVEVNHLPAGGQPYAKFAIGELKAKVYLK